MKEYSEDLFHDIGMIVVDEVHRTGTEVFSRALQKFNFGYSLGLSATVKRKDGLTKAFVWFIGDVVYKISRRKDLSLNVVMREFFVKDAAYCAEYFINGKTLNMAKMVNNVCDYELRTRMMVSMMQDVYSASGGTRRFLVLSDRKSQLKRLHALFNEGSTLTSGFYIGGMKPAALEESLTKHVILATYSFASEGFDAQHLDTLLLASPKTDIEQSVGRILRVQAGGERVNVPLVIDVVDAFSMFDRQANKRRMFYKRQGYDVYSQPFDYEGSVLDALKPEAVNKHEDDEDKDDHDDLALTFSQGCAFKDSQNDE
jgi:superfamily II DNA or RNA helicase